RARADRGRFAAARPHLLSPERLSDSVRSAPKPRHLVEVAVPGRIYTRGNRPGKRKEQVMSVKLFVGGLSFSTSSEGLRGAFARFGEVMSAAVMTDRETGRSRGFGFVEMATRSEEHTSELHHGSTSYA